MHSPADSLREHLIFSIFLINNSTDIGEGVGNYDFILGENVPILQTVLHFQVRL